MTIWPFTALARRRARKEAAKAAAEAAEAAERKRELEEGRAWLARVSRQHDAWLDSGGPLRPLPPAHPR